MKPALFVWLWLAAAAVAVGAEPWAPTPSHDPSHPFIGMNTAALLGVGRVEFVKSRKSDIDGVTIETYRATILVKRALPQAPSKEFTLLVDRPAFATPTSECTYILRNQKSPIRFQCPLEKGATFVLAFDWDQLTAWDSFPITDAENLPVAEYWSDCERFHACLQDEQSKRSTFDAAVGRVIADPKHPPGGEFFRLVNHYDPAADEGKEFSVALAGYLTNRDVPLLRRVDLMRGFSENERGPELQKFVLAADLRLLREISESKGGTPYLPNALLKIYRTYLLEPPRVSLPLQPYAASPLKENVVQPMPALSREGRALIQGMLRNPEALRNTDPRVRSALEMWVEQ